MGSETRQARGGPALVQPAPQVQTTQPHRPPAPGPPRRRAVAVPHTTDSKVDSREVPHDPGDRFLARNTAETFPSPPVATLSVRCRVGPKLGRCSNGAGMTRDESAREAAAAGRRPAKPKRTTKVGRTGARFPSASILELTEPDTPPEPTGNDHPSEALDRGPATNQATDHRSAANRTTNPAPRTANPDAAPTREPDHGATASWTTDSNPPPNWATDPGPPSHREPDRGSATYGATDTGPGRGWMVDSGPASGREPEQGMTAGGVTDSGPAPSWATTDPGPPSHREPDRGSATHAATDSGSVRNWMADSGPASNRGPEYGATDGWATGFGVAPDRSTEHGASDGWVTGFGVAPDRSTEHGASADWAADLGPAANRKPDHGPAANREPDRGPAANRELGHGSATNWAADPGATSDRATETGPTLGWESGQGSTTGRGSATGQGSATGRGLTTGWVIDAGLAPSREPDHGLATGWAADNVPVSGGGAKHRAAPDRGANLSRSSIRGRDASTDPGSSLGRASAPHRSPASAEVPDRASVPGHDSSSGQAFLSDQPPFLAQPSAAVSSDSSSGAVVEAEPREDGVGPIGARFGPYSARKPKRVKENDLGDEPADGAGPRSRMPSDQSLLDQPPPEHATERTIPMILPWAGALVRPYAHTGGRTRSSHDFALEALVSTSGQLTDTATEEVLTTHHRRMIVDMCVRPRSVAEVAALLSTPLGVARVLLGDLAGAGAVVVHPTAGSTGDGAPDVEFMRRVLVGLRRL
jgi:hypothetical protein